MSKTFSKVIIAGILGVAAGVAVGLLFAPAKGVKTRKRLKKKLRTFADDFEVELSEKIGDAKAMFSKEEDRK